MKSYLLLLFPSFLLSQIQIGSDINGEKFNDLSGESISLSANGKILAIGARSNDGSGFASGHVRVFKNESNNWIKLGENINGENSFDGSGNAVSLSADGKILAVGAQWNDENGSNSGHVRVYKFEEDNWVQMGSDIDGEASGDLSGFSVSLSSDGQIIAIGAPLNQENGFGSGHVRIYRYKSDNWIQIGEDIDGKYENEVSGNSICLSSDGSIIAIGSVEGDNNGSNSGLVRVYKNLNTIWTQLGNDINGEAIDDFFGTSLSLSSDGTVIAIGASRNDRKGNNSGHVCVYKNLNNSWVQIGDNINGEASGDVFGNSVSISSDGSIVVVGAIGNDQNGIDSGQVKIYKNISNTWIQIGTDIGGEFAGDSLGDSVSLSSDGSILAIGASRNQGNGENSGHVRVYDLSNILSNESFERNYFSYFPNPVKNILNIQLKNGLGLKQATIYNLQGQHLFTTKQTQIDVSNLPKGIYFVNVETNIGISADKIIIE
ncbi:hypothetical protein MHTCC0001_12860 [Flavobacteriaceae bacterium MHTCC 0001]